MLSFSLKVTLTLQKFERKTKIFQFEINVSIKHWENQTFSEVLTHFIPVFHFYTPWKRRKTFGFLTFSVGKETEDWAKKK